MWMENPHFPKVLNEAWATYHNGCAMFRLVSKLKLLKVKLKTFNKINFSDISSKVSSCRDWLARTQRDLQQDPLNTDLLDEEKAIRNHFESLLKQEEAFYKQKSRVNWLELGDSNTKFFHSMVMQKKNRNKIIKLKISNGSYLTNQEDIKSAMIDFYKSLLGTSTTQRRHCDGSIIAAGPVLDEAACVDLCKLVSAKEIKESMLSIPSGKAQGPDGFNSRFFQKNWSTVGNDVIETIREFFRTGKLLGQINVTTLTIIPKS